MRIAIAADHAGFQLKEEIKKLLEERSTHYEDFGTYAEERTDYTDWGARAVKGIVERRFDRGILICGTGLGMGITANKFFGIRATPCYELYAARMSREHNNSNVLVLGGRIIGLDLAKEIVSVWLTTPFKGGRYQARLDKLKIIEQTNFK